MISAGLRKVKEILPVQEASAHCDGPCGVYDPSSARIAAEAVVSMTKKILALETPSSSDPKAMAAYHNTLCRYIQIKEEQAHIAKTEILVLWTDYFKPVHLEKYPDLHDIVWKATKLCSACKQEINLDHANALMEAIKKIHEIFWESKDRRVEWYTAS
ncbi:MAG: superoxide dismutase, Ni [Candidatus Omnitrophica bacterium]|nr:superoxide dismutase, Ni [Candidatus Omnitrophota bacterium]